MLRSSPSLASPIRSCSIGSCGLTFSSSWLPSSAVFPLAMVDSLDSVGGEVEGALEGMLRVDQQTMRVFAACLGLNDRGSVGVSACRACVVSSRGYQRTRKRLSVLFPASLQSSLHVFAQPITKQKGRGHLRDAALHVLLLCVLLLLYVSPLCLCSMVYDDRMLNIRWHDCCYFHLNLP